MSTLRLVWSVISWLAWLVAALVAIGKATRQPKGDDNGNQVS